MGTPVQHDRLSGSLDLYLREIGSHPLLDREEEVALARACRDGDRRALERLVASNLRFVVSVAKRYQNRGVALADLINEGNLGLIRAAERFDEAKGVRFISYAVWWIRQAILQAIADQSRIVRVPPGRTERHQRITREARALSQELGRWPTADEVAADLALPPDEVREALDGASAYVSLDAPVRAEHDARLLDLLPDEGLENPHEDAHREELRRALEASLTHLGEREALVLRRYFGLDGNESCTLEEIGGELRLSRERVRQIKDRALARLRYGARGTVLASFYR